MINYTYVFPRLTVSADYAFIQADNYNEEEDAEFNMLQILPAPIFFCIFCVFCLNTISLFFHTLRSPVSRLGGWLGVQRQPPPPPLQREVVDAPPPVVRPRCDLCGHYCGRATACRRLFEDLSFETLKSEERFTIFTDIQDEGPIRQLFEDMSPLLEVTLFRARKYANAQISITTTILVRKIAGTKAAR